VNALPLAGHARSSGEAGSGGKDSAGLHQPAQAGSLRPGGGATTSGGELVAGWAKGAKVVKIFNTTGYANMANPSYGGQPITIFYCCDNADAKRIAAGLARDIGFDPVDAGCWSPTRLLWIWLAVKGGVGREFAFKLVKR